MLALFHSEDYLWRTNPWQADYATPAWQPWLSGTNFSCLDSLQNCSLWLITGHLVSTPLEALRLEADVQIYHTYSNRLILKAREKSLRSTDDHPKRVALAADILNTFKIAAAFFVRPTAFLLFLPAGLEHCQSINHFPSPPWRLSIPPNIPPGIAGRAKDIDLKHRCSLTLIASYQADYTIYTNGCNSGGKETGTQQQLSLEDAQSSLKWVVPSKPNPVHQLLRGECSCLDIDQCQPSFNHHPFLHRQ